MLPAERDREQVNCKTIKIQDLMRLEAFAEGYDDIRQGRPYNQAAADDDDGAWAYERGRQVAIYARSEYGKVPPLCRSGVLNPRLLTICCMMDHEGLFL